VPRKKEKDEQDFSDGKSQIFQPEKSSGIFHEGFSAEKSSGDVNG